jgi:hypothetical protein
VVKVVESVESQSSKEGAENEAKQSAKETIPDRNLAELPEPAQGKPHAEKGGNEPKEGYWSNKRWKQPQVIVNAVLAFFTFLILIVYSLQLGHMKWQARLDQRAWVGIESLENSTFQEEKPATVELLVRNTGKTPAKNFRIIGAFGTGPAGAKPDFEKDLKWKKEYSVGLLMPNGTNRLPIQLKSVPVLTKEKIEEIKDHKFMVFVFGWITYDDVFGISHRTNFCYRLNGDLELEINDFGNGAN